MYRQREDELDYAPMTTSAACSDEPMRPADHKSKKHPRPRRNEKVGGGHFVFRRGRTTGRIKTGSIMAGKMPFEHPSMESARAEASRLQQIHGGRYDVFSTSCVVDGSDWEGV